MSLAILQKVGISVDEVKEMLTNAWDKTTQLASSDYVRYPLIGAGIGGLGMGTASAFGGHGDPENPESAKDRIKRITNSALRGAALGGATGLGAAALKGPASKIFESGEDLATKSTKEDPLNSYVRGSGAALGGAAGALGNVKNHVANSKDKIEDLKAQASRAQQAFDHFATTDGKSGPVGLDAATIPASIAGKLRNPNFKIPVPEGYENALATGNNTNNIDSWVESQIRDNNFGQTTDQKNNLFERIKSTLGKNDRANAAAPSVEDMVKDTAKIYHTDVTSTYADKIKQVHPTLGSKAWAGAKGAGAGAGLGWLGTELGGRLINSFVSAKPGYEQPRNNL